MTYKCISYRYARIVKFHGDWMNNAIPPVSYNYYLN